MILHSLILITAFSMETFRNVIMTTKTLQETPFCDESLNSFLPRFLLGDAIASIEVPKLTDCKLTILKERVVVLEYERRLMVCNVSGNLCQIYPADFVRISSDGSKILTMDHSRHRSEGFEVSVWDNRSGDKLARNAENGRFVPELAVLGPKGALVSNNCCAQYLEYGEFGHCPFGHPPNTLLAEFSKSGNRFAFLSPNELYAYEFSVHGLCNKIAHWIYDDVNFQSAIKIGFSLSERFLYIVDGAKVADIDIETGEYFGKEMREPGDEIKSADFFITDTDALVALGYNSGKVKVCKIVDDFLPPTYEFQQESSIKQLTFSKDGTRLVSATDSDLSVWILAQEPRLEYQTDLDGPPDRVTIIENKKLSECLNPLKMEKRRSIVLSCTT